MAQNQRLQIPITSKTKKALEKKAEDEGFSSANDMVRLLIHKFIAGDFVFQIAQNSNQQYPMVDIETEKRIAQSIKEIQNGEYDLLDFEKNPNAFLDLFKK